MLQSEPRAMKEIHTIRAQNYERTKDLTPEERNRLRSESAGHIAERYGFRVISKDAK